MKWLTWDKGRQDSGYEKMLLATSKFFKFDCYILKFPDGVGIPTHVDPSIPGYEHHRFNFFLTTPSIGTGVVTIEGPHWETKHGRAHKFRPDLYQHHMTPARRIWSNNATYILSIGWLKKKVYKHQEA